MLVVGSKLIGTPVMSLHVGGELARTKRAIVDPEDLRVIAYELTGAHVRGMRETILRTDDVREYGRLGLIVDSVDELVAREDVVRIDEVMKLKFDLIGLKVVTKKGRKVGRLTDYTVDAQTFLVQQIIVQKSFATSLVATERTIDRSEIVEVTDGKIVIKDDKAKAKSKARAKSDLARAEFVPNFVNPFREPALNVGIETEEDEGVGVRD